MKKQVDKDNYIFEKYCTPDRWASYWHQINEIIKLEPDSMLEAGVGDKVLASYLKNNTGIRYQSLDIADDLGPDIIGSIDGIPCRENEFDLACAFEVLEHLPFEKFQICLGELARVSKRYVIISLPHWGRHFSCRLHLPYFGVIKCQKKINFFNIEHKFNGEHYWEIGKKGYGLDRIKKAINNSGLEIRKDYIVFESPYHHFFILSK